MKYHDTSRPSEMEKEEERGYLSHLLYGAGFRLSKALRLRVKDIDFDYEQITVRQGRDKKDRRTILSEPLEGLLRFCPYSVFSACPWHSPPALPGRPAADSHVVNGLFGAKPTGATGHLVLFTEPLRAARFSA